MYDRDSLPLASNPFLPDQSPIMSMNSMYELRGYDGFKNLQHPSKNIMPEDTARILKHGYYASVSYVDELFGQVIQHLKDLDIYDNTIVIVWGDHGWKLGEHNGWCKQTNYNIDIHVPMMIHSPGQENPGAETYGITELIDMYPTLCELTGIETPSYLHGTSFLPLMDDPKKDWKDAAFSQFHRRPKVTPDGKRYMGYSIKTKEYHYVAWFYWDDKTEKLGEFVTAELYDNINDPNENVNIAMNKDKKKVVIELSKKLRDGWRGAIPK